MANQDKTPQQAKPQVDIQEVFTEVLGILQEAGDFKGEASSPEDIEVLMKEMEATITELSEKSQQLYEEAGMTQEDLQKFGENPDNFAPDEWRMLQEVKEEIHKFEEEADRIAGEPFELAEAGAAPTPAATAPKKPATKRAKGKRTKRKDWMAG